MARTPARLAARLERLEDALGAHQMSFRTASGRVFTMDVADVLAVAMDCMTWMYDETADQPRGPLVERLAAAEPDNEQGLIGHTAIAAARQAVNGVRA